MPFRSSFRILRFRGKGSNLLVGISSLLFRTTQECQHNAEARHGDLGETFEDIMESSLLSKTAWTKLFDEDGGRSYLEVFLRELDDEQEDLTTEFIETLTHQTLQVAFAFLAGALSMCILGTAGALSNKPNWAGGDKTKKRSCWKVLRKTKLD